MVLRGLQEALPSLPRNLETIREPHGPLPARGQQRVHGALRPRLGGCGWVWVVRRAYIWFTVGWIWQSSRADKQKVAPGSPSNRPIHARNHIRHTRLPTGKTLQRFDFCCLPVLDRLELDGAAHHGRPGLVDQAQPIHRPLFWYDRQSMNQPINQSWYQRSVAPSTHLPTRIRLRRIGRRQVAGQRHQHIRGLLQVLGLVPVDSVVPAREAAVVVAWG